MLNPAQQALTDDYLALLAKTGEDRDWIGIDFDAGHIGADHFAMNDDGIWEMINSDRGNQYIVERFLDRSDLMFTLCSIGTWEAAKYEVEAPPNTHWHMLEELYFAQQLEWMSRIDERWGQRLKGRRQKMLRLRAQEKPWDTGETRRARAYEIGAYIFSALLFIFCAWFFWPL